MSFCGSNRVATLGSRGEIKSNAVTVYPNRFLQVESDERVKKDGGGVCRGHQ
jgi:hypothetical protein